MLLRYHSHFLTSSNFFFPKLLSTPSFFSLLRTTTSVISSQIRSSSYGPSLQKGTLSSELKPLQNPFLNAHPQQTQIPENGEEPIFDEEQFTRVFEIAAIRVPSERCFEIEGRLRGHLLNWPRISNIARVPGDEIDWEVHELLKENKELGDEVEVEKAVSRRVYGKAEGDGEELSGVLYRDKLAKEFNARGFVKFRNLAKISRPNQRKKRQKEGKSKNESHGSEGEKARGKRRSVVVEVVEDNEDVDGGDDLSGLLGDDLKEGDGGGLLDCCFWMKHLLGDHLMSFLKLLSYGMAVLNEGSSEATNSSYELVRCNMTLLYDYWSNDEVLEALLPKDMVIPSAFETVGHIAHLNLKDEHLPYKKVIAKVVLDKNKPKIRTVVNKIEAISNDYRTMELEVLAGNHSLVTTVNESGMRFQVDLAKVYVVNVAAEYGFCFVLYFLTVNSIRKIRKEVIIEGMFVTTWNDRFGSCSRPRLWD
ncbi:hypothetical protein RDABS01_032352 [Bienertia sinuspersici]